MIEDGLAADVDGLLGAIERLLIVQPPQQIMNVLKLIRRVIGRASANQLRLIERAFLAAQCCLNQVKVLYTQIKSPVGGGHDDGLCTVTKLSYRKHGAQKRLFQYFLRLKRLPQHTFAYPDQARVDAPGGTRHKAAEHITRNRALRGRQNDGGHKRCPRSPSPFPMATHVT